MKRFLVLFVIACSIQSCDTRTDNYPTLEAARKDRLFERGWLPNILPNSTKNIRTSNDLDINIAEGRFSFDPVDFKDFERHLTSYTAADSRIRNFGEHVRLMKEQGYNPYQYSNGKSKWVFFCKTDECLYTMW